MKLQLGLYLDLLAKAVKVQGEIRAATTWTKPRVSPRRGEKEDKRWETRLVFSHQIRVMASHVSLAV